MKSFALDLLLVSVFAVCVRSAHSQAISWSHAMTATTTLTVGLRLDPTSSRWIDSRLRPLSPYAKNKRANGAYLLPDYRLMSRTCDKQYLGRFIGNWSGPRILTQAIWWPVGYLGARLSSPTLSIVGMTAFNVIRARTLPDYHIDALGYLASIGSWGVLGASSGRSWAWSLGAWSLTYPWSTPWVDDPQHCEGT